MESVFLWNRWARIGLALALSLAMSTAPAAAQDQAGTAAQPTGLPAAAGPTVQQLEQELKAIRAQLRQLQQRVQKQEETPKQAVPTPTSTPNNAAVAAPLAPIAPTEGPPQQPWSPAAPIRLGGIGSAYMNISFDVLMDAGWSTEPNVPLIEPGDHDPDVRGFTIPNTEVVFDGAVDPYFKGLADIVFKLDQNGETQVELEEAYGLTSSLPWNLQAKAGQYLVEFGRQNQQHPHQWDFVDQALILNRMFGPEGLRSQGVRVSWLAPTPFYSELFLATLNSSGGTAFSFRNTQEELFGRPPVNRTVQSLGDLLYVPRYVASFDLTDAQTLVTGVSAAFGPNASGAARHTQIYGVDVFWKWKPSWQSGGFPFVAFQTEAMARRYQADAVDVDTNGDGVGDVLLPYENLYDYGFYSQVLYGFTQRWVAGLRGEWAGSQHGAFGPDPNRADRIRVSPDLTFFPTEFSKVRLQYNADHGAILGNNSSVWLQFEFLLGSHGAHKF